MSFPVIKARAKLTDMIRYVNLLKWREQDFSCSLCPDILSLRYLLPVFILFLVVIANKQT